MKVESLRESDQSIVRNPMLLPFLDLSLDEIEILCRVTAKQEEGCLKPVDGAWFASFMKCRKEPVR